MSVQVMTAARTRAERIRAASASTSVDPDLAMPVLMGLANTRLTGSAPGATRDPDRVAPEAGAPVIRSDPSSVTLFKGEEDASYQAYADGSWRAAVEEGLVALGEMRPAARAFAAYALGTIVVRRDLLNPHPHSSSWRTVPTFAALTNIHASPRPVAFAVNALVHESIHSVLYCYEACRPLLRGDEIEGLRLESPWTGARLRPVSYVHACHVWYGLVQLWLGGDRFAHGDVDFFLDRARRGFFKDPAGPLEACADHISAEAVESVRRMTGHVAG